MCGLTDHITQHNIAYSGCCPTSWDTEEVAWLIFTRCFKIIEWSVSDRYYCTALYLTTPVGLSCVPQASHTKFALLGMCFQPSAPIEGWVAAWQQWSGTFQLHTLLLTTLWSGNYITMERKLSSIKRKLQIWPVVQFNSVNCCSGVKGGVNGFQLRNHPVTLH